MTHDDDVRRGAGIYSSPVLKIYDMLVVKLSNSYAWRCRSELMLEQYNRHLGRTHLDVGPGTGWYLAHTDMPDGIDITLMDLNPNSLDSSCDRISRLSPKRKVGNVLGPIPGDIGPFDSIGVNYLFHCVPGDFSHKGRAFTQLASRLTDDGTLFGATILGTGVHHNLFGKALMALYARLGIFHNRQDSRQGLEKALEAAFDEVQIRIIGTVALFVARSPKR